MGQVLREVAKKKLYQLLFTVYENLRNQKEPVLKIPKRSLSNVSFVPGKGLTLGTAFMERRLMSVKEARKFMQTLLVASVILRAIEEGDYPTIRDIYYTVKHTITYRDAYGKVRHENTFDEQKESDDVIQDLEVMLGILREGMGVMFDAKGRAAGKVIIKSKGSTIDLSKMGVGAWAIPPNVDEIDIVDVDAEYVLIIEKGAVFERLNNEEFWKKHRCVLVTGKGQPDRGTRRFVRRLHDEFGLPVYVLADADPYGAYIYLVYKIGSISLAYESERLAVLDAKWLGVWPSDITRFRIPRRYIIKATPADIKRAKEILRYEWVQKDKHLRRELELFLKRKDKVEIEAFSGFGFKYLSDEYIPRKLTLI